MRVVLLVEGAADGRARLLQTGLGELGELGVGRGLAERVARVELLNRLGRLQWLGRLQRLEGLERLDDVGRIGIGHARGTLLALLRPLLLLAALALALLRTLAVPGHRV